MTPNPRQAGFTLLEILVALSVLGLLLLALAGGTRFGIRALAVQERAGTSRGDLMAADRTLRTLLAAIVPGPETDPPGIVGDAHRLAFTTRLPALAPAREVDAALGVAGNTLVLRWTPRLHAVPLAPAPPPQQTELLPGVARIDLAYWRPDAAGGWLAAWNGHAPPALIRLRLAFSDPARRWPDIVVAPMRHDPPP